MAMMIDRDAPMSGLANLMAMKGRQGDTELIHMTKPEIRGLASLGKLTVNPDTGLPEAFSFKSFLPAIAAAAASAMLPPAAPMFASVAVPAAAAGATSYAINRDAGAAAFDALLAGAGGALGSYVKGGAEGAAALKGAQGAVAGGTPLTPAGVSQAIAVEEAGRALAQTPGGSLLDMVGVNPAGEFANIAGKSISNIEALGMGASGLPTALTALGQQPQQAQLTTPAGKSAESAYGTRAAEEIKMTPQAAGGLTTEDIRKSAIGQSDPIKFFQSGAMAEAPSGIYGTPRSGVVGQPVKGMGPVGSYVPAQMGGGIEDLYDRMGGDYEQFSGLVEGSDIDSDGMSDDVIFKVMKEEEDDPDYAMLSPDEYVIDAHTVAALGNGSTDSGTERLDKFVASIREKAYNKGEQPKQLNGLKELASLMS